MLELIKTIVRMDQYRNRNRKALAYYEKDSILHNIMRRQKQGSLSGSDDDKSALFT